MRNHILWIEDDFFVIKSIMRPLEKEGFKISNAPTAYDAVSQLVFKDYDLIVVDLILPLSMIVEDNLPEFITKWGKSEGYFGIQIIKFIRQNLEIETPILILSIIQNPVEKYSIQSLENIYCEGKSGLLPSRFKETALRIINQPLPAKKNNIQLKITETQQVNSVNGNNVLNQLRVFLCHSSKDKPTVKEIFSKLKSEGFDPWLDEINLLPGQEWDVEIKKAVKNSHVVLVCLSNSSVNKEGYVQKEIRFALDVALEKPDGIIYIIPTRLEECKVPETLLKYQFADYFNIQGWDKLLSALRKRSQDIIGQPQS